MNQVAPVQVETDGQHYCIVFNNEQVTTDTLAKVALVSETAVLAEVLVRIVPQRGNGGWYSVVTCGVGKLEQGRLRLEFTDGSVIGDVSAQITVWNGGVKFALIKAIIGSQQGADGGYNEAVEFCTRFPAAQAEPAAAT